MWDPAAYTLSAKLFLQCFGVIYLIVFASFLPQIQGLLGKEGILPISDYLRIINLRLGSKRFFYVPSLFWINASDTALYVIIISGMLASLLLTFYILPPLMLILLYLLYISIVSTGQDFLSFGWDVFILEITINAFLLSLTTTPNPIIWISINFLLFRFYIQAGAVKLLSRDQNWSNLTAVKYHYETQPLPNTVAWYVYRWPLWFHKLSVVAMFVMELIVPFGMFGNAEMRLFVFIALFFLQFSIWITGNFAYLNHLSLVFSIILVADAYIPAFFGTVTPMSGHWTAETFITISGGILLFLQVICLWHHFMPNSKFATILGSIYPFHLANRYGIFAVMTVKRYEIIVQGSNDGNLWKEYTFYFKPSELTKRPKRVSPYHPRLDWQAWFLPFDQFASERWFQQFLVRLLQGSPHVLKLLKYNPFPEKPPKYIRAVAYDYTFTTPQDKKKYGFWWNREYVGQFSPTLSLKE